MAMREALLKALLSADAYEDYRNWRRLRRARRDRPERHCPICGYRGRFRPHGKMLRPDAECGGCGYLERHRLLYLYLTQNGVNKLDGKEILHFSPEPLIGELAEGALAYVTADITDTSVDMKLDLTDIALADNSYDLIMANHVLEHVPDDRAAFGEIHRILRPDGCAILTVPLVQGWTTTYEDPAITDPAARERHFGRWDHVRYYGRDFADRLAAAGFRVETFQATPQHCVDHAVHRGASVCIAHKPHEPAP